MVPDNSQSQDVDLDRTDELPILDGTSFDDDVADDAVRLDYSPVAKSVKSQFRRSSSSDLRSLAESVRSVEERIARRNVEFETLTQSHEDARAAEAEAASRAASLGSDLAQVRALLESEQARSHEQGNALAAQSAAADTLRDTVAVRDATIAQVLHSLAERDAQLSALQREHAQIVPSLEERSTAAVQLEADLRAARARIESVTADLNSTRQALATLTAQLKRRDEDLQATRRELNVVNAQAAAHLERLRTREFRRVLDENAGIQVDHAALLSEGNELRRRVADLGAQLATREEALARLQSATLRVQELERTCADFTEKMNAGSLEAQRGKEMLSAAEQSRADLALEVLRLRSEAQEREGQMEVLLVHLQEARRLLRVGNAEAERTGEPAAGAPAARSRAMEQLAEENRSLQAALDRTRGALEEREFILRRLERSESTDANTAERVQPHAGGPAPGSAYAVELIRIDGSHNQAHALGRRTRIGRAPGCELHIDSTSVSRHHALVLTNLRDVIIEDLHSTNGVLVNGRKVTRQLLTDGDILTVGEAQFRLSVKPGPRKPEATPPGA